MKKHLISTTYAILASIACIPLVFGQQQQATEPDERAGRSAQLTLDDLRTFTDVFNQARKNYVEEVDDKTLLDAAIRGMLMELDPHSSFLPANELEDLNDASLGRYSGVGIDVQAVEGRIEVKALINDSPADRAGMNPGDIITSIDGRPVRGRPLPEAMDELTGEPDTEVVLKVLSPGEGEREISITRRYIQIPTLSFQLLDDTFGYFKMSQFHQSSSADLESSLDSIKNDGIVMKALILDLRGNPGGVLRQAVAIADGFLDSGNIVSTRGRNATMQLEFNAEPGQWLPGVPLMILVDYGTASASEVLAGALQDQRRALIVGERTFGKGSVQSVLPLRNGAGIKLTTARYYTPSGRSIQAEGIEPDVVIVWESEGSEDDGKLREIDLERHLAVESGPGTAGVTSADYGLDELPLQDVLNALREAEAIPD
ncbi:MAG: S41 family peptidase [Xanthomonadales bacterium]|nr:S41 family peptidase [Gammaproteobacteria bacterium]MBT8054991.1 S41 family peptidase [Gammaproteobacteria bacterium]NND56373.1 S41 family peptidase [Xanthomonadales bacterium]NNK50430.1 S41 family peptidase [Xanthomonadales bacterium]